MIVLPVLEQFFYIKYLTPVFLILFVFGLIFKLIRRA